MIAHFRRLITSYHYNLAVLTWLFPGFLHPAVTGSLLAYKPLPCQHTKLSNCPMRRQEGLQFPRSTVEITRPSNDSTEDSTSTKATRVLHQTLITGLGASHRP